MAPLQNTRGGASTSPCTTLVAGRTPLSSPSCYGTQWRRNLTARNTTHSSQPLGREGEGKQSYMPLSPAPQLGGAWEESHPCTRAALTWSGGQLRCIRWAPVAGWHEKGLQGIAVGIGRGHAASKVYLAPSIIIEHHHALKKDGDLTYQICTLRQTPHAALAQRTAHSAQRTAHSAPALVGCQRGM